MKTRTDYTPDTMPVAPILIVAAVLPLWTAALIGATVWSVTR